ncbi:MAG: adenylate cyclase, partial [Gammaproteobacteria bacterium]
MGTEIEKKYLIVNDGWREHADEGTYMVQGYMGSNEKSSVRIRINGDKANLNIKSKTIGIQRSKYDYAIPIDEAKEILETIC